MEDFDKKAQSLVDIQREIRQLEERKSELKFEIISHLMDHGSISCNGGIVQVIEGAEWGRLDQERLRYVLQMKFDVTEQEADDIINDGKVGTSRLPTVIVRLN